ncbi:hypothetical protein XELAEV_18020471mg [Xenopus laevis]|uniref:Uncharacterized protein n=1 Tax=Xenopus laevis TaxID=8355 RepID=A0A974D7V7_XENLA|nr:hypothetical protein XELAEV_18020471mg [Xenopus laevis]
MYKLTTSLSAMDSGSCSLSAVGREGVHRLKSLHQQHFDFTRLYWSFIHISKKVKQRKVTINFGNLLFISPAFALLRVCARATDY